MKTLNEFKKDFKKNTVEKFLCKDLKYQLSKSLDEAIVVLRELRNKHDSKYENLHIEIYGESYCGNDDDDNYISVELKGKRLETDEEFKKRIDLEYMRYQQQWDRDRAKYKYLKRLFEGDENI